MTLVEFGTGSASKFRISRVKIMASPKAMFEVRITLNGKEGNGMLSDVFVSVFGMVTVDRRTIINVTDVRSKHHNLSISDGAKNAIKVFSHEFLSNLTDNVLDKTEDWRTI